MKDESQRPVNGVRVQVNTTKETIREALTDDKGFYVARRLKPDTYLIQPSYEPKADFSPGATARKATSVAFAPAYHRVTLTADGDLHEVDFRASGSY